MGVAIVDIQKNSSFLAIMLTLWIQFKRVNDPKKVYILGNQSKVHIWLLLDMTIVNHAN